MSKAICSWLTLQQSNIRSATSSEQNQNNLCEWNWRTVLKTHALKRVTWVAKYLPIKINKIITIPHKLVSKSKIDLHNMLPMFVVAHLRLYHYLQDCTKLKTLKTHHPNNSHWKIQYHQWRSILQPINKIEINN